jgi:hypothetical protein
MITGAITAFDGTTGKQLASHAARHWVSPYPP